MALTRLQNADEIANCCYLLAMLYARFLTPVDQSVAERYLLSALEVLADANIPDADRHFLSVFNMNGLAFVRLRQGRVSDALELCTNGIKRLSQHLDPERHRLHRSVLLFNIAQVHAQIGPYEDAIEHFTQAMALDSSYSEYYKRPRRRLLQDEPTRAGRTEVPPSDQAQPPYPEVWVNLGQCYRAMDRMEEAARAYTRAVDLDPNSTLASVGRAEAQLALDRPELALTDYDHALTVDRDQPLVLASRAIAHYQAGHLSDAITDLDIAVKLAPDLADLYHNRAVALRELGRCDQAVHDLNPYLQLSPNAEDRAEVDDTITSLASAYQHQKAPTHASHTVAANGRESGLLCRRPLG